MASKTSKSRRGASGGPSTSSRTASRTGRSPSRKNFAPPAPSVTQRAKIAVADQLGSHFADATAITLLVLASLTALGLSSNVVDPVGSMLRAITTGLVGRAAILVPVGLVGIAIVLFSRRGERGDPDRASNEKRAVLRVCVGSFLLLVACCGALTLVNGRPDLSADFTQLRDAGGLIGSAVVMPLTAIAGTVGAAIVLAGVLVLGLLLVPGLPMRDVFAAIARGYRWCARTLLAYTELDGEERERVLEARDSDSGTGPAVHLYDQYADGAGDNDADATETVIDLVNADHEDDEPEALEPEVVAEAGADTDDDPAAGPAEQLEILGNRGNRPAVWKLPPRNVLKRSGVKTIDRGAIEQGGAILEDTMHEFGVDARLVGMTVGPTVTRYELELGPGVKVNKVTGLNHDIAYAMASPDVRILAPIPGRSAIGVEVPNRQRQLVTLGDILASDEAKRATHPLEVALGRDISGKPVMCNLATMPHVLIAGQTGSGKSSCINSIITSLLMRTTPDQVRLILVDPKRVELGVYNDVPHLLTQVVTNPKKAANALDWAVREMELRYDVLAEVGVRDIGGFNAAYDRGDLPTKEQPDTVTGKGYERLPYIVVVVDELNDLMMVAARDVEQSICRIAQMARAVGIHLVIATQRPSVNVITGVIKANVPSRLAFAVSSLADSRVILDQPGAERLVGQGDMLMMGANSSRAERIQGNWVDEDCVHKVVAHWKRQAIEPTYVAGIADDAAGSSSSGGDDDGDDDPLIEEAMEIVVRSGMGSTSMLQRKLRVGFARAGRIMDELERKGVVGPSEGSKARAVLMTVEEFEERKDRLES